jgi:hypothetical protein
MDHLDREHDGDIVKGETAYTHIGIVLDVLDSRNEIIQCHHGLAIDMGDPHGRHKPIHVGWGTFGTCRNIDL